MSSFNNKYFSLFFLMIHVQFHHKRNLKTNKKNHHLEHCFSIGHQFITWLSPCNTGSLLNITTTTKLCAPEPSSVLLLSCSPQVLKEPTLSLSVVLTVCYKFSRKKQWDKGLPSGTVGTKKRWFLKGFHFCEK